MNTAILIETTMPRSGIEQRHYQLEPPVTCTDPWDESERTIKYVVVSATFAEFTGPETYIFEADKDGEITNWVELDGSFQGEKNHNRALANIGYWPGEAT